MTNCKAYKLNSKQQFKRIEKDYDNEGYLFGGKVFWWHYIIAIFAVIGVALFAVTILPFIMLYNFIRRKPI